MNVADAVKSIYIAPESGEPMEERSTIEAVAGQGLRGDRYFRDQGLYDRKESLPEATDATLIEIEAPRAAERDKDVSLDPELTRRNVVTEGVPLNHLVDRTFRVGTAVFKRVRLCEPCSYMQELADVDGSIAALTHRGGLNTNIIETGTVAIGDSIEFEPQSSQDADSSEP